MSYAFELKNCAVLIFGKICGGSMLRQKPEKTAEPKCFIFGKSWTTRLTEFQGRSAKSFSWTPMHVLGRGSEKVERVVTN